MVAAKPIFTNVTNDLLFAILESYGGTMNDVKNITGSVQNDLLYAILEKIGAGGGAGGGTYTQDITLQLTGGKTLGRFGNGQTIPLNGKTLDQAMAIIGREPIQPTATINGLPGAGAYEIGTTLNIALSAAYTANSAPNIATVSIRKNGVQIATATNANDAIVVGAAAIVYQAIFAHAGNTDIAAGNVNSNTIAYSGFYYNFFGNVANIPSTPANVRALNLATANQFILQTGTVNNKFAVVIPSTKSITNVTDISNLNANLTSNYVLQNNAFVMTDADGNNYNCKLYVMQQATPYTTNAQHQITIS